MSKTLIINGADFSTNKLDTVSFDVIPCTGISLAESSANVSYEDTYTAVATVTPADTTQEVVWSSNNPNFPVNNGVVSINGVGQAVITATCGSYSASVTLTSKAVYDIDDYDTADNMSLTYATDYCSLYDANATGNFVIGRISETDYHTLWSNQATKDVGETFSPAIIPPGSTYMKITYTESYGQSVAFADMSTEASIGYGAVEIVDHDSNYVLSAERTIEIPTGADGYYVAFRKDSETFGIEFT